LQTAGYGIHAQRSCDSLGKCTSADVALANEDQALNRAPVYILILAIPAQEIKKMVPVCLNKTGPGTVSIS
jgi:hypothetical protein